MSYKKCYSIFLVIISCVIFCLFIWEKPCLAQPENNVQEMEPFIDRFLSDRQEKYHIPGITFSLIKDGKIVFAKGYGYADLEKKIPVVPEKTAFRVGSVSKLLTATAVMQLAEQGKLNLKDDINKYLKSFQIDSTYSKPITFANLLTHTDGFDSGWGIGAFVRNAAEMMPLREYISQRLPPRILPPGEVFLYSDVGITLAGYLVEEISGIPFAQYIDKNILEPLDMNNSSFLQPLPPPLDSNLAVGYKYTNGSYKPRPFAYGNSVPAGLFSTTAIDMAHFIICHLQSGRYEKKQILKDKTIQEMHRQQFTHHPLMPGSAYGFYERFQNQQRGIEHGGRMDGYTSLVFLLPEQNSGFFVACNTNTGILFTELVQQFLDQFYPSQNTIQPIQILSDTKKRLQQIQGFYRYNRYSHSTIEKLGAVLGDAPEIKLIANNDGTLSLSSSKEKWKEVKPWLFRLSDREIYMTFQRNKQGKITYMFIGNAVLSALEKLSWYESISFQSKIALFCAIVFVLNLVVWAFVWLSIHIWNLSLPIASFLKFPLFCSLLISFLNLIFILGMGKVVFTTDFWDFFYGLPKVAIALLYLPPITLGLTVVLFGVLVFNWFNANQSAIATYYSFIGITSLLWLWFLNYWNLLGFRIY